MKLVGIEVFVISFTHIAVFGLSRSFRAFFSRESLTQGGAAAFSPCWPLGWIIAAFQA